MGRLELGMTTNINIRVSEEIKKVLKGYAKLENKTISDIVMEAIMEKIENDYDYKIALLASEIVDLSDTTTLKDLCDEVDINYEDL